MLNGLLISTFNMALYTLFNLCGTAVADLLINKG